MPLTPRTTGVLDELGGYLTAFWESRSPLSHPCDLEHTKHAIGMVLRNQSRKQPHRDEIQLYLESRGVARTHAEQVGILYEGRKRTRQ